MKVIILTQAFLETTLSLAHYLSKIGLDVNVICINYRQTRKLNIFDFEKHYKTRNYISKRDLEPVVSSDFFDYLKGFDLSFHFIKGNSRNPFVFLSNAYRYKKLVMSFNPDIIHIIQGSPFFLFLAYLFPKRKLVYSLHEITNHFGETARKEKALLNFIIKRKIPLIVHSKISRERFLFFAKTERSINSYPVQVIYFGLFEVYSFFDSLNIPPTLDLDFDPSKFKIVLFYGRITPDKGVDILLSAFNEIELKYNDVYLVVAGAGKIDYDLSTIKNIKIINRFLSNEEIVYLNKMAYLVICPYLSASQSGIPMTSFLFNIPIIASDVGAFSEVIRHQVTGILVPVGDIIALKNAISKMLDQKQLYNDYSSNISGIYKRNIFDWKEIAFQTKLVYSKRILTDNS